MSKLEWKWTRRGIWHFAETDDQAFAIRDAGSSAVLWIGDKPPTPHDSLAAAKAAAEAALTPERDPLEPIAWALSLAGHRPGRNDFYLNKTAAEIDARNGYEVIPLVDGRKVATLLGKDQPETPATQPVQDDLYRLRDSHGGWVQTQPVPPVEMDTMNFTGESQPEQPVQDDTRLPPPGRKLSVEEATERTFATYPNAMQALADSDKAPVQDDAEAFAERVVALSEDKSVVGIGECSGFFSRAAGSGDMLQEVADARRGIAAALRPEIERWKREARREERERVADWLCNRGWTVASDYVRADAAKGAT